MFCYSFLRRAHLLVPLKGRTCVGNSHLQKPSASCEARIDNDNEANELRRGRNVKSSPPNGMPFKGFLVPEENKLLKLT